MGEGKNNMNISITQNVENKADELVLSIKSLEEIMDADKVKTNECDQNQTKNNTQSEEKKTMDVNKENLANIVNDQSSPSLTPTTQKNSTKNNQKIKEKKTKNVDKENMDKMVNDQSSPSSIPSTQKNQTKNNP